MTRYLLDTDVLIDFSTGMEPATSFLLSWLDGRDVVGVCAITISEFSAGLTSQTAEHWQQFLTSLAYWDISTQSAMRAGQDRFRYARQGSSITTPDALMASVAREQNATLVTGNVKDFPMTDISLLSIR